MEINQVTDWKNQWKEVEFFAKLEVFSYGRGRSSAVILATDGEREFVIFLTDYFDMLRTGDIKNNKIEGVFIVKKRGRNLGIRLKSTSQATYERYKPSLIPDYV
jgi:hypothetical protein